MSRTLARMADSIALPPPRLSLAVTGHREINPAFARNRDAIVAALDGLFAAADRTGAATGGPVAQTRLSSLLAHGADLIAVEHALARGWEVVAPLPFGLALNIAINADPATAADARALIDGAAVGDDALAGRAARIADYAARARLFELAEADEEVGAAFLAMLNDPTHADAARHFTNLASDRVATAGRLMIEQSDVLIAIWDGETPGGIGGTRHTIAIAAKLGIPIVWINASSPSAITILHTPEEVFAPESTTPLAGPDGVEALFASLLAPAVADQNERAIRFHTEQWHARSHRRFHAYRRVEALFGGQGLAKRFGRLTQHYEAPGAIAAGSGAMMLAEARALPGGDAVLVNRIEQDVLQRFAWADGLSTYLSDAYRGGMVTNFILSAMAIVVGVSYLPFKNLHVKWPFALGEFLLLVTILGITTIGRRKRWHGRWFETRRVAEYFRHAPIMLLLGVARATGRWPRGAETEWPEYYAREVLRDIGLPVATIRQPYLRALLDTVLGEHVQSQRRYHEAKAARLTRVHHGLDRMSEMLFVGAVLSVSTYLLLIIGGGTGVISEHWANDLSKIFTVLGVTLPALGGALAGIRYFGDFERFAAISEVTAEKLQEVEQRIVVLQQARSGALHFGQLAELAHAIDEIVVSEIESWQAVFRSKQIAVPV